MARDSGGGRYEEPDRGAGRHEEPDSGGEGGSGRTEILYQNWRRSKIKELKMALPWFLGRAYSFSSVKCQLVRQEQ